MRESDFVSYAGPPELHDGVIVRLEQHDNYSIVLVRDADGVIWECRFLGVTELTAQSEQGMILYALAEYQAVAPWRRFGFINWDDEGDAFLEIVAQHFEFSKRINARDRS